MKPEPVGALADLLEPYPLEISWQLTTVRALILKLDSSLEERVYKGWQIVKYGAGIYLGPKLTGLYVGFLKGMYLPDPHRLLTGKAKEARRYWWGAREALKQEALTSLISAALAFEADLTT